MRFVAIITVALALSALVACSYGNAAQTKAPSLSVSLSDEPMDIAVLTAMSNDKGKDMDCTMGSPMVQLSWRGPAATLTVVAPDIDGELLEEVVDVEDGDQFLEIYGTFAEKTASRCTFDTSFSVVSDVPVEGRLTGGAIIPDGSPDLNRNYKHATFTADVVALN